MRKSIRIQYQQESFRIAWYEGASDASIRETIKETLQISPDYNIVLLDDQNSIVAISEALPDGLVLFAELRTYNNSTANQSQGLQSNASTSSLTGTHIPS